MSGELQLVRRGFRDRIGRVRRIFARATGWPLAVRLAVFAAALAAQVAAYPTELFDGATVLVLPVLATLPALWPRTAAVSAFWLVIAFGWLAATTLYGGTATLVRLIAVAVALYLVHTGAALAAVLPYDAVVDPTAILRWVLRAAVVLALSLGVSVAGMLYAGRLAPRSYLAATLVGLGLTVALAWLIALAARRR